MALSSWIVCSLILSLLAFSLAVEKKGSPVKVNYGRLERLCMKHACDTDSVCTVKENEDGKMVPFCIDFRKGESCPPLVDKTCGAYDWDSKCRQDTDCKVDEKCCFDGCGIKCVKLVKN